jgi:branched-chain amino acid transport system substrate-binding protein
MNHAFRRGLMGVAYAVAAVVCAPTPSAAQEVTIGAILDLAGPVAPLGNYVKTGIDLALAEVNAAGGVKGQKVRFEVLNSESKPDLAASLALRFASQDDVVAIVGGNFAASSNSAGAVAERNNIVLLTPTALLNEGQSQWKNIFFTLADFSDMAKAILELAKKSNYKTLALLRLEREYGETGSRLLHRLAPDYGVTIVGEERGADGDRDFTAQLTKLRQSNPDYLVVWFANPGGALVLKNIQQLGWKIPTAAPLSMDGNVTTKLAGRAAENVYVVSQIAGGDPLPRQKSFVEAYAKANPAASEPNTFEALGYDLVKMIVAALGSIDPPYTRARVRDAVASMKYEGAAAVVDFTQRNSPTGSSVLLTQIHNGKFMRAAP